MNRTQGPVFAANWKMNIGPRSARTFFADFLPRVPEQQGKHLVFFPPAVSLAAVVESLSERGDIAAGGQNIHGKPNGAYTGEISAPLLAEAGGTHALVGHSERRQLFGESVEDTIGKCKAALGTGLEVVLCVGETLDERRAGRAEEVVRTQLAPVLQALGAEAVRDRWMIAYEPVWAIGTGETASPEDAQQMHAFVRRLLRDAELDATPVLYGGSVKPDTASSLLAQSDVDGVLVGGASLEPSGFAAICNTPT